MTALDVATGLMEKLQKANEVCLERLHKAQDVIKNSERQLADKDRIIKMLESRLKVRTDGILETTNRQRELTIKHSQMQIQKLLKENEEYEKKINAIKAQICVNCENNLLLRENDENKDFANPYKHVSKAGSLQSEKNNTSNICPNRVKSLEKTIKQKDIRITNLSKEVQYLRKTEKELTQKLNRLVKIVPKSGASSGALIDTLLKEIHLSESKKLSDERLYFQNELQKLKSNSSVSGVSNSKRMHKLDEKKHNTSSTKQQAANLRQCKSASDVDISKVDGEIFFKKLQKLCNDVSELKCLFMLESKKISEGLNSTVKGYDVFKLQLEEIIYNLNDVAEGILNNNYFSIQRDISRNATVESDKEYVISCLQERLKECVARVAEYEKINKTLTENLHDLRKQFSEQSKAFHDKKSDDQIPKSHVAPNLIQTDDVEKLKEIIKSKEQQLESAQSHITTCQKFIAELQKSIEHADTSKMYGSQKVNCKTCTSCREESDSLKNKLEIAYSQIDSCANSIVKLQNTVKQLEDKNESLEIQLHKAKNQKIPEGIDPEVKDKAEEEQITTLFKSNQELQDKVNKLEDVNSKLEADIAAYENRTLSLQAAEQERDLLKTRLEDSERKLSNYEKSIQTLREKLQKVENKKNKLEVDLKGIDQFNNLAETYENDVIALKDELMKREEEIRNLTESLHTLENKALEMKHYRKSLHQEIEKLCKALMENEESEDSERRKAIYKAAVLHSAQALLRLDDNFNLKPEDSERDSVLDEMKHQIEVYLTEVSRIHELVTIKEQERDELLREYLNLDDDILRPSSSLHHESVIQGEPVDRNLQSFPNLNTVSSLESDATTNPTNDKISHMTKSARFTTDKMNVYEAVAKLKLVQEELASTKSVTNYLLNSCGRLEELLAQERASRAKCERELEVQEEIMKDLKCQVSMKDNVTKTLNNLLANMQSTECNNELTLEKLKSDISWLMEENQKRFERITATQLELCQCKEENARIQNDLDTLKRELCNEKYENAKVNNELKRLRLQISQS